MNVMVMSWKWVMNWFMKFEHLSIANVLVIAHTVFSISLLGCGSPYMGISFSGTGSMPPPRT